MLCTLKEAIVLCSCLRKHAPYYQRRVLALCRSWFGVRVRVIRVCKGKLRCSVYLSRLAVCEYRFLCSCRVACGKLCHVVEFVRGRHSDVSDSCLCDQMPFHMHALFWLCLVPSPSFSLLAFESKPSRTDKGCSPGFHSRFSVKSCSSCSLEASVFNYLWSWSVEGSCYF